MNSIKLIKIEHLTTVTQAVKSFVSGLVAELAEAAAQDIAAVRSTANDAKTAANTAKTAADSAKAAAVVMKSATASAAGTAGLAPAPAAGAQTKYLRGDGTWQTPPDTNTTYTAASAAPKAAGTAAVGTSAKYAREDHVHPAQTTVSGNAATATKLATARTINGTSFDGSGNITTANWGTARNLTIGGTTKSVNGSGNVAWSLAEIGAFPLKATKITTQAELDKMHANGIYSVEGFTPSGLDDGTFYYILEIGEYSGSNFHVQLAFPYQDSCRKNTLYIRTAKQTTWQAWHKVVTEAEGKAVSAASADTAKKLDIVTFTVGGDKTKYYPVLITTGGFAWNHINIYRGYGETAPSDWGTDANHKGGLTLCVRWSGDSAWGGNDHTVVVDEFQESYCKMVGGLALSTNGLIVWLRGGSAVYHIQSENGGATAVSVKLDTYTASNKATYSPREYNATTVENEVKARWKDRHGTYNGSVTGNAGTATKLATARKINGVAFDGSADINIKGFAAQNTAPTNTSLLWIDTTAKTGGLKYHNGTSWVSVPVSYT